MVFLSYLDPDSDHARALSTKRPQLIRNIHSKTLATLCTNLFLKPIPFPGIPLREYTPFNPATLKGGQPVEHLDWGKAHLTALSPTASWIGSSNLARQSFALTGSVPTQPDETHMPVPACRPVGQNPGVCRCLSGGAGALNDWPSLSASWDLGAVTAAKSARAVVSYDDEGAGGRYFGVRLSEHWRRHGLAFDAMLVGGMGGRCL